MHHEHAHVGPSAGALDYAQGLPPDLLHIVAQFVSLDFQRTQHPTTCYPDKTGSGDKINATRRRAAPAEEINTSSAYSDRLWVWSARPKLSIHPGICTESVVTTFCPSVQAKGERQNSVRYQVREYQTEYSPEFEFAVASRSMDKQPPSRVVANLRVLAATGNLPKTVSKLINAIKPHMSEVVFCSPSAVLKEVCQAEKQTPTISYLQNVLLEVDEKLDEKALVHAQIKAQQQNAVVVQQSSEEVTVAKHLAQLFKFPQLPPYPSKSATEAFITCNCVIVKDLDPLEIIRQLKALKLVSTDDYGNITYLFDSEKLDSLQQNMQNTLKLQPQSHCAQHLYSTDSHLMETEPSFAESGQKENSCSNIQLEPVILATLNCFQKWGEQLPRTELRLANALRPTCKVVLFYKPTNVLQHLDKQAKHSLLCCFEKKTLQVTAAGLFGHKATQHSQLSIQDYSQPVSKITRGGPRYNKLKSLKSFQTATKSSTEKLDRALNYLEKLLTREVNRSHGSIACGDDNDITQAVQRVQVWLAQKQCAPEQKYPDDAANRDGADGSEVMETEGVEPLACSEVPPQLVSTEEKLSREFLQLCVTSCKRDPESVICNLKASNIIQVMGGSEHISYEIPNAVTLTTKDYITREQYLLRQALASDRGESSGVRHQLTGMKRRRHGRKEFKKLHL